MQLTELHTETLGLDKDGFRQFKVMFDQTIRNPLNGKDILIPKDFVFNGASVPRVLRSALPSTGKAFNPSAVHDFMYSSHCLFYKDEDGVIDREHTTFLGANKLFKALLKEYGVNIVLRNGGWIGLNIFGIGNYKN